MLLAGFLTLSSSLTGFSQVGIGTTKPHESAILDISSNNQGFLPPRMNNQQMNNIVDPAVGLLIYNSDEKCLFTYDGDWTNLCDGTSGVFNYTGHSQVKFTADTPFSFGNYGSELAVNEKGNILLLGYPKKKINNLYSVGEMQVFLEADTGWVKSILLHANDFKEGDHFGSSISISASGDVIAVSSPYADTNGVNAVGKVYIFRSSGNTWIQEASFYASDYSHNANFGYSISISADGNTLAIGADRANNNLVNDAGAVYIYTKSGNTWIEQEKLVALDAATWNGFGRSVRISHDAKTAIISGRGGVYVFNNTGGSWSQQQKLIASDSINSLSFGESISISGDGETIAVGSYHRNGGEGGVYIFTTNESNIWVEEAILVSVDTLGDQNFGESVDLSTDGRTVAVGAAWNSRIDQNNPGNILWSTGATHIYSKSSNVWKERSMLTAYDAEAHDWFGRKVRISGNKKTVVVGAPEEKPGGVYASGAFYIFQ